MTWIKSRKILFGIVFLTSLLFVQFVFIFFQELDANRTENVVKAVLRQEESIVNPQRLSQNLLDLKATGIISCLRVVRDQGQVFLGESAESCRVSSPLLLTGSERDLKLKVISGEEWQVHFTTINQTMFITSLWLARLSSVLFSALAFFWFSRRQELENQALELERKNALAASDLAYQVAHDIRSPLSALSMVTGLFDASDERKAVIQKALLRINGVANELLQKYRGGIGNKENDCEIINIHDLARDVLAEKNAQLVGQRVTLKWDSGGHEALTVKGKADHLSSVISNLINNSIEASPDRGGEVTLSTRIYDSKVHVVVSDNGKGIPTEILNRIGERGFTYGKNGSTSGNGLGIYLAKKTIENMGGQLHIVSKVGHGTMVTIILPALK